MALDPTNQPGPTPLLEVSRVSKSFGGLRALADVSLSLRARSLTCLLGPNGAGKSTLFQIVAGTLHPDSGDVLLEGKSLARQLTYRRARQGLGVKLQVPCIYSELSVHENLWLAAYSGSRKAHLADHATSNLLNWLRLEGDAGLLAGALSHGQQQWLEIAMVMARRPRAVLLDEPTAGMTHSETLLVGELVKQMQAHAAVLVVEHDMDFVRALDCKTTLLVEGSVFATGTLAELRDDERVLDIYLGRA